MAALIAAEQPPVPSVLVVQQPTLERGSSNDSGSSNSSPSGVVNPRVAGVPLRVNGHLLDLVGQPDASQVGEEAPTANNDDGSLAPLADLKKRRRRSKSKPRKRFAPTKPAVMKNTRYQLLNKPLVEATRARQEAPEIQESITKHDNLLQRGKHH